MNKPLLVGTDIKYLSILHSKKYETDAQRVQAVIDAVREEEVAKVVITERERIEAAIKEIGEVCEKHKVILASWHGLDGILINPSQSDDSDILINCNSDLQVSEFPGCGNEYVIEIIGEVKD